VARIRPLAREAGDEHALDGVAAILEEGGAARQRAAFAAGGMGGLLRDLVEQTGNADALASPSA
jgi:gamma-glutamyl:cysteine ligase YbdK (ATP-grasp superfamily)